MDQQTPTPNPSATSTASTSSQAAEPPKNPPQPQQQQQQQQQPLSSTTVSPTTNPNPLSKPPTPLISQPQSLQSPSQTRPHSFPRSLPQQRPHIQHFSSPHSSLPSPSPSTPTQPSPSNSAPLSQRGGMAIGVPAQHPVSSPQPAPPFSSIGQQYGSLANSNSSQVRPPVQGMQGMGMMGSLGSSSQMRPGAISGHHQQRPVQSSLRSPSSPNNQSNASQNFQGPGFMRVSSVGSPASNTLQSASSHNQPWLSGSQGKPPLPNHSYRAPMTATSLQQRSHIPRQNHPLPTSSQQHHVSSGQSQQPLPSGTSHQPHEHFVQQFPSSRAPQSSPHQQPIARVQGSGSQKPSSLANTVQAGNLAQPKTASAESDESGSRILSKRSIHELVNQIDPLERLDAEVEDILVDIADNFLESVTTFGCSLAKHRKSDTLEAKDILVPLERNWNITLPGFSGDEIKTYKKPLTNDIHKERLASIKKSIIVSEVANARNSAGQTAANAKGNLAKAPGNSMVSPNFKTREVA